MTVLQLLRYLTASPPRDRGVVLLWNNAEENGLYGACAFANSPFRPAVGTFLNLEGAGAGGRARARSAPPAPLPAATSDRSSNKPVPSHPQSLPPTNRA
ncbi:M28 family peptidase, partial [bacterium]|nr:M28 family peptidase [bacterium]